MTVAQRIGGAMHSISGSDGPLNVPVDELDRDQHYFYGPRQVRRLLEDYRAILTPYIVERPGERDLPRIGGNRGYVRPYTAIEKRIALKADIDRSLIWLQYANKMPNEAEAIHLYYLTTTEGNQPLTQVQVAGIMGCTEKTVRNRIDRGTREISWYLGFVEEKQSRRGG